MVVEMNRARGNDVGMLSARRPEVFFRKSFGCGCVGEVIEHVRDGEDFFVDSHMMWLSMEMTRRCARHELQLNMGYVACGSEDFHRVWLATDEAGEEREYEGPRRIVVRTSSSRFL